MFKTILFFIAIWGIMILAIPVAILLILLGVLPGLRRGAIFLLRNLTRLWARFVIFGTGSSVSIEGAEKIPSHGGVCFVANHPGDFDIILALAFIKRPFGFIAKREILFFPFVNLWVFFLGGLFIDRKNVAKAHRSIERGARRIRNGGAMIIFPEGTRSRGKGVLPFKGGSFKLATLADAPIVPVAISGSYTVWEETKTIQAARVRMVFCDPIPTAGLQAEDRRRLVDTVRDRILQVLETES
jgi:1-acyl-sn-glycerol-3-phosphate acyltransferase